MKVVGWVNPSTWQAVVDVLRLRPEGDELTLIAVVDDHQPIARAPGTLMGRGHPGRDPRAADLARQATAELLQRASTSLGRECATLLRQGRTEHEVVASCVEADLLVMCRDGDRSRLGPRSLGPHGRFVVDHAPCQVLLVWPDTIPALSTIPRPPRIP